LPSLWTAFGRRNPGISIWLFSKRMEKLSLVTAVFKGAYIIRNNVEITKDL
jgi:hypothetical protein